MTVTCWEVANHISEARGVSEMEQAEEVYC